MKAVWLFGLGFAVRLVLLAYGYWQDATMRVKFTDVDYYVFSDAARFIAEGESPYERETYRYTPLLAMMLTPNIWLDMIFGKLLFVGADLLSALVIFRLLLLRKVPESLATWCTAVWILNPMVFTISTRGNAEAIVALCVLLTLYFVYTQKIVAAGICFGLAVHLKVYPIIYALPIYFFINEDAFPINHASSYLSRLFSSPRLKFAFISAGIFLELAIVMYTLYGWNFVDATYLYHLTRKDHRHNFSVYFYLIYLNFNQGSSALVSVLAFLPQVLAVSVIGWAFYRDIAFCCFVQTLAFVAFNKVCTSQYFIWYITFLPLVIPWMRFKLSIHGVLLLLWIGHQAWWLSEGYKLEFLGLDSYFSLWLASLGFFATNVLIIISFLHSFNFTPTFQRGSLTAFKIKQS